MKLSKSRSAWWLRPGILDLVLQWNVPSKSIVVERVKNAWQGINCISNKKVTFSTVTQRFTVTCKRMGWSGISVKVTYRPNELPENGLVWLSKVRDLLWADLPAQWAAREWVGVTLQGQGSLARWWCPRFILQIQHLHLFFLRLTTWKCKQLSMDNFTAFYTDFASEMKLAKLPLTHCSWKTGTFGSQLCVGHTEIIRC